MTTEDSWISDHCLRGLHSQTYNEARAMLSRIDALEAENARLREALKRTTGCLIGLGYETDPTTEFARKALETT